MYHNFYNESILKMIFQDQSYLAEMLGTGEKCSNNGGILRVPL
jgi:hypothetical protein